jgi:plasmid stabilization system protein ParE
MASRKPQLTVSLSPRAADELDEIYRYNIRKRGRATADRYITFLNAKLDSLAVDYDAGKPVESRPDLRYLLIKKTGKWKDGHIAVYQVDDAAATVDVWFIFHTKQDWENKL